MISFLIFYFVFTGIIAIGVVLYKDDASISDYVFAFLFGFIVIPLGIGALMAKFASDDITIKIKKRNED